MDSRPASAPRSLVQSVWRVVPLVLAAVAVFVFLAPTRSGPRAGSPAESFDLPVIFARDAATSGARLRLDDVRGEPMLVEVFASFCPECRASAGTFNQAAEVRRRTPVQFVAISLDDDPEAGRAAGQAWGFRLVAHDDGDFARAYEIRLIPTLILIDRDGTILHAESGRVGRQRIERWLAEVGAPPHQGP